jgi:hypothetical protein
MAALVSRLTTKCMYELPPFAKTYQPTQLAKQVHHAVSTYQCVTNIEIINEYEYEYIRDVNFGTNTNTNIFVC